MKSYRKHNQKLLQGSRCFTGRFSRKESREASGRRRQKAAKEEKYIPSLAAVAAIAAITALAAKIKNIRSY